MAKIQLLYYKEKKGLDETVEGSVIISKTRVGPGRRYYEPK